MSVEVEEALSRPTIPLEEAGRLLFGMKPGPARAAAKKGEIPAFKIGKRMLCATASLRKMLALDEPQQAA